MNTQPIFNSFEKQNATLWGQVPQRLQHRLDKSELFGMGALAKLLDAYPREHYNLVQWGAQGTQRGSWREGEIGGLSGDEAINAIAKGRIWINMRNVPGVDARYGELLAAIFKELKGYMPDFDTFTHKLGILISSPGSRTLYHADLPGQSLWQIAGRKRVYVYPPVKPFLAPEHIEGIALSGVEVNMPYEPWYDQHAQAFDLEPGQMLHWQLNAPHRVDNYDCLNVSMTLEYFTDEIRREHIVTVANGIMRSKLGIVPKTRVTTGPSFLAKAVMQKALRNTAWVKSERKKRPIDFRLDRHNPGAIIDLAGARVAGPEKELPAEKTLAAAE